MRILHSLTTHWNQASQYMPLPSSRKDIAVDVDKGNIVAQQHLGFYTLYHNYSGNLIALRQMALLNPKGFTCALPHTMMPLLLIRKIDGENKTTSKETVLSKTSPWQSVIKTMNKTVEKPWTSYKAKIRPLYYVIRTTYVHLRNLEIVNFTSFPQWICWGEKESKKRKRGRKRKKFATSSFRAQWGRESLSCKCKGNTTYVSRRYHILAKGLSSILFSAEEKSKLLGGRRGSSSSSDVNLDLTNIRSSNFIPLFCFSAVSLLRVGKTSNEKPFEWSSSRSSSGRTRSSRRYAI